METNTAFTVDGENEPSTNGTAYFLTYNIDADEAYLTYGVSNSSVRLRFMLNPNGQDELLLWMDNSETWFSLWKQPVDNCDFYARCGPYGSCHRNETLTLSSPCKCLTGFRPKFQKQWDMGNWSGGCVREKPLPLRCDNQTEGYFQTFERLKLPDQSVLLDNKSIIECKSECNQNCSCTAYAYINSTESSSAGKCLTWFGDLMDVVENQTLGPNIYVRLQGVPHGNSLKRSLVIAIVSAIAGLITIIFGYFLWKKTWGKGREYSEIIRNGIAGGGENDIELPLFSLKSILAATNNFSEANKLGEGGFGPVYKGILHVHEVAMKRLSKKSGQGHQEFMNELKLIANLQHTNLVRLLGCCVEDEEQILVYEYMPNRSLDKFLFDPSENTKLDWDRRFHIIEGIAQGVLYIHKYSRLKIIHRDLKASNVLLDEAMNPKISDFGMAKIFEINQTEANTNRIVGTYGYMSPEYARYGHFSEKSDVFSFGVLLLEIISGKKNASFYHYEHSLTLAGWAWKLWKEGRGMEANEGTALPPSKEPAFSTHRNSPATGSSSQPPTIFSVNSLTISTLEGR
ncbi:hypothetical protein M0R45_032990 [Rubus argutus]|uniref:non-specific serine/threonine protein kinase n=1 Tax=Rubus argutus TaxID=59490 RepID=A0AAW1WMR0_RUBAR